MPRSKIFVLSPQVLHECKETAAKRRRQSTRLENLGIPEEELLRQQQELFAKAREAGRLRIEGKEYVVQDGDVLEFRFNV